MNSAPWKERLTHAIKTNDDEAWSSVDKLLVNLAGCCSRSISDVRKLLYLGLERSGYDPDRPNFDGNESDDWLEYVVFEAYKRLRGVNVIHSQSTSSPIIMHSIDVNGRLLSVTDSWCELTGYHPDEVLGMRSTDLLTDESRRLAIEIHLPKLKALGSSGFDRYTMISKSGKMVPVGIAGVIERDDSGKILRTLGHLKKL